MPDAPVRYQSAEEDSGRWSGFPFRDGDIVISTRSKSGTTWMQMICALLVFQTPQLPGPLRELSPWLDRRTLPRDELFARLAAQQHRRFIKSHTPLDGIPSTRAPPTSWWPGIRSTWPYPSTTRAATSTGPGCGGSPASPSPASRRHRGRRCTTG